MPLDPMTKEEHERVKASSEREKRCNKHIVLAPRSPVSNSFSENGKRAGY